MSKRWGRLNRNFGFIKKWKYIVIKTPNSEPLNPNPRTCEYAGLNKKRTVVRKEVDKKRKNTALKGEKKLKTTRAWKEEEK
jgi:hypothetical protein